MSYLEDDYVKLKTENALPLRDTPVLINWHTIMRPLSMQILNVVSYHICYNFISKNCQIITWGWSNYYLNNALEVEFFKVNYFKTCMVCKEKLFNNFHDNIGRPQNPCKILTRK